MVRKQASNMQLLASELFWLISLTEKLDGENTKLVKKINPIEAEEFDTAQQVMSGNECHGMGRNGMQWNGMSCYVI
jgi:hypothetical protein